MIILIVRQVNNLILDVMPSLEAVSNQTLGVFNLRFIDLPSNWALHLNVLTNETNTAAA